jgi:hypothetical protein
MSSRCLPTISLVLMVLCPCWVGGQSSKPTCLPTVEVPEYMTIRVGETNDWNVEFCNQGPDTAQVVWTLTPGGCDTKLSATPTSGSSELPEDTCDTQTVKVTAPPAVCATNDADFPVVAVACNRSANDFGKICIMPTGEHSVATRRLISYPDQAFFYGFLDPISANFTGRSIRERRVSVHDDCVTFEPGDTDFEANPDFLNNGQWTILSGNRYNVEDRIGGGSLFPQKEQNKCEVTALQAMEIECGNGSWFSYHTNSIKIQYVQGVGMAVVYRGSASSEGTPLSEGWE